MSSSRVYLISGSCLRLRRFPRPTLPHYIAPTHINKRLPQHTIRVYSGWRRNGRSAYRDDQGKIEKESQLEEKREWEDTPYEPSRREKMWQDRMNHIRRLIEEDPYEALFGRSNRLLRGIRQDWPLDHYKWWQKEVNFVVRNPFAEGKTEATKDVLVEEAGEKSTVVRPKAADAEPEPELEYDPISNRMVQRVRNRFSSKEMDLMNNIPAKPNKQDAGGAAKADIEQAIDIPIKPYRPNINPSKHPALAQKTPSFTMLKEDLASDLSMEQDIAPATPVRAEYEDYKAMRLQTSNKSKHWLVEEGFSGPDWPTGNATSSSLHSDMDKQFDDLHSKTHELAEKRLVDNLPWTAQRSKGTHLHAHSPATSISAQTPTYDEAKANKEVREYHIQVAGDNLKNRQLTLEGTPVGKDGERRQPISSHHRLVHPASDAHADKEIHDYTMKVAGDNIKNKRLDDKLKLQGLIEEWKVEARRRAFAKFNEEGKRLAELRQRQDQYQKRLSVIALKGIKNVREMIQDAAAELAEIQTKSRGLNTFDEKSTKVTEEIPTASAGPENNLETSLQRYREKTAVAGRSGLRTSLQRLSGSPKEGLEMSQVLSDQSTEQARTHDPVGYNHSRESDRLHQLTSNIQAKNGPKVPSLAEVFGYKKSEGDDIKHATARVVDVSATHLQGEVEAQKTAFQEFESGVKSRISDLSSFKSTAKANDISRDQISKSDQSVVQKTESITQRVTKELEQKRKDAALVREIRHIYEEKYGPITTSHTQPLESTKPAEEPVESKLVTETNMPTLEVSGSERAPISTAKPEKPENPQNPQLNANSTADTVPAKKMPASNLTTPIPAKTARYKILAYDSKSKNMTTASFESIPSPTESAIPGTIALRHLAYANRFLAKLIELQHRGFVPVHAERNLLILRQDAARFTNEEYKLGAQGEDPVQNETLLDDSKNDTNIREPKRLEPVFSGRKHQDRAWRSWKEARRVARHARRRRFRRAVKFIASGIVLSGVVIYLAGVGAEVRQNRGRGKVVVTDDRRA